MKFCLDTYTVSFPYDLTQALYPSGKKLRVGVIEIEADDINQASMILARHLVPFLQVKLEEYQKLHGGKDEVQDRGQ